MKTNKKLVLKKERIARLSEDDLTKIVGGEAQTKTRSTVRNFTCCWCSFGASEKKVCLKP